MPLSRAPRPGNDQRFQQSRQRYGEENSPEPPDTPKEKHRHNDRHRMNIVRFREQNGSQYIAIQRLKHTIGHQHIEKFVAHAEMKTRYRRDWQRTDCCPDVRHKTESPNPTARKAEISRPESPNGNKAK